MAGSMLPPDVQEQMKRSATPQRGAGGIGAAAPENDRSARARAHAIDPDHKEPAEAAKPVVSDDGELKACPRCRTELKVEWNFCMRCGADLIRGGAAKYLGITFTEEDVHDYLFRGYITREVAVFGKFKVTLKSSQPTDIDEIDRYVMTGPWRKGEKGVTREVSNFYLEQINTLCMTAACAQKFNGESMGATLEQRMEWLMARGSALVDQMGQKAILFNRAITDHLKAADTVLGS